MTKLSVIIPTHQRASILTKCLDRLEQQTIAEDIEVIVVSDGHDDATSTLFRNMKRRMRIQFFEIPKSQQGVARNKGVEQASGEIILFIGDDIFLEHDACEKHFKAHASEPKAVLGFTTWDPAVGVTRVMQWLEESGWQFGYPKIKRYKHKNIPASMQHRFSYTSNISLPREVARKHPFIEDISLYGWEDVEWGLRLKKSGIPLYYEPYAVGLHHHPISLDESLRRMETLGRSVVEISEKVPGLDRLPSGWKYWMYKGSSLLRTMAGKHRKAFLKGIAMGYGR